MTPSLPALAVDRNARLFTVTALYMAQGIQVGLMMIALPAYMAAKEVSPLAISAFISIPLIPWTFKFLAAPLMDRFSFLPMGRRRPWVIFGMLGAAIGYLGMAAVPDPMNNITLLTFAAFIASMFTSFMDVAVDGMAIDVLPAEEQSLANGYMWGGKTVGRALTAAGAAFTLSAFGPKITFITAAALTISFAVIPIALRERSGERILPWTSGEASPESLKYRMNWKQIFKNLFNVFKLPSTQLVMLLSFFMGVYDGMFDTVMPVFTVQELGWKDTTFSSVAAGAGLTAGLLGMAVGGLFIQRFGLIRSLRLFLVMVIIPCAVMGAFTSIWKSEMAINIYVFVMYIFKTLGLIALFALAMIFCWKPVSATQFAIFMATGNLGISSGAALFGLVQTYTSYANIFFFLALPALIAMGVLYFVGIQKHLKSLEELPEFSGTSVEILA